MLNTNVCDKLNIIQNLPTPTATLPKILGRFFNYLPFQSPVNKIKQRL